MDTPTVSHSREAASKATEASDTSFSVAEASTIRPSSEASLVVIVSRFRIEVLSEAMFSSVRILLIPSKVMLARPRACAPPATIWSTSVRSDLIIGTGCPGRLSSGLPVPAVSCTKVMPVMPASWIEAVESSRIGVSRETRMCARTFEGSALSMRTEATSPTFTPI